jgi:hypothetical protein
MEKKQTVRKSWAEVVTALIVYLRDEKKSKGVHSTFSGLNEAIKAYGKEWGEETNPIEVTKKLAADGVIEISGCRSAWNPIAKRQVGGVMVYLKGEGRTNARGRKNLEDCGLL